MKRTFRLLGSILASGTLIASGILLPPLNPVQAAVGQLCATPGKDGAGGTLSGTINTYYAGIGTANAGATSITVGTARGTATPIAAGDLLLVIQMQDAVINSTNTAAYGDGVGGDVLALTAGGTQPPNGASGYISSTAGTYEYVVVSAVSGSTVTIRGKGTGGGLINTYSSAGATPTQGQRTYQVVRVPQYATATLGSATALAWNGSTGGILAYDVAGNLNLAGTASVDGLGFRGGGGRRLSGDSGTPPLLNTDFVTSSTRTANGSKGEGIAGTPRFLYNAGALLDNVNEGYPNGSYGRGAPGNAGGGSTDGYPLTTDPNSNTNNLWGNGHNSGGGGGANGGRGGIGGRSWFSDLPTGGFGGKPLPRTLTSLPLILGGGGGAGTTNDGSPNGTGINSSGAAGGGMVMIRTNTVSGTGTINARGATALNVTQDGGGGGGAGGSVLVAAQSNNLAGLTVNTNGGKGGDAVFSSPHGPGGGGGGGVLVASPGATFSGLGGSNGFTGNPATSITNGAVSGDGLVAPLAVGTIPGADSGAACVPNLSVTKTTSTAAVTNTPTGTTATYTITVSNEVNRLTASNVSISDTLPTGFTYASLGTVTLNGGATRTTVVNPAAGVNNPSFGTFSIPGNGSVVITFTVNIPSTVANGTYDNPATATYNDPALTTGLTTSSSYNPTSSTAENVTVTAIPPSLLLVKRITAISGTPTSGFNDLLIGTKAADDNNANWPTPPATYLRGLLNGSVSPGAEVEYTIYFLNNQNTISNVSICDPIPDNLTFVSDGYNSAAPRPTELGALPTDTGIALASNATVLPINPTVYLTNANDSDRGRYYPPNDPSTPNACKRVGTTGNVTATGPAANTNGAIVVNVVSGTTQLPPATTAGNPANSYGFVRFKARVK